MRMIIYVFSTESILKAQLQLMEKVPICWLKILSSSITIDKNVTVTWTNTDAMPHTVTADDNSFTSDELNQNDTYSHTFTTDGTFAYHCAIHTGMKGTVVVNY